MSDSIAAVPKFRSVHMFHAVLHDFSGISIYLIILHYSNAFYSATVDNYVNKVSVIGFDWHWGRNGKFGVRFGQT